MGELARINSKIKDKIWICNKCGRKNLIRVKHDVSPDSSLKCVCGNTLNSMTMHQIHHNAHKGKRLIKGAKVYHKKEVNNDRSI